MNIPIIREYYENDVYIHSKNHFELKPKTVTHICGCNGYGKSTVVRQIQDYIHSEKALNITERLTNPFARILGDNKKNYKYFYFDFDVNSFFSTSFNDSFLGKFRSASLSNGEGITDRCVKGLSILRNWLLSPEVKGKTVLFFMDDLDAGTSIDMIDDIKEVISLVIKDCEANEIEWYIVAPINSYEFTCNNPYNYVCIDARSFEELSFKTYNRYKQYVYKTRKNKIKRYKNKEVN